VDKVSEYFGHGSTKTYKILKNPIFICDQKTEACNIFIIEKQLQNPITMEHMMKIKIKKLSACDNPQFSTPQREDYKCGEIPEKEVSLFVDYEAIGVTESLPQVGKSFQMLRIERNGVSMPGLFSTSSVTKIEGNTFETANSIYQWEEIKETL